MSVGSILLRKSRSPCQMQVTSFSLQHGDFCRLIGYVATFLFFESTTKKGS